MVGAAGLEPGTTCLEAGLQRFLEVAYFQPIFFEQEVHTLLKLVELC